MRALSLIFSLPQVILQADKTSNNFSDRAILKNLGHWLGMQTLAKNKPILQIVSRGMRSLGLAPPREVQISGTGVVFKLPSIYGISPCFLVFLEVGITKSI